MPNNRNTIITSNERIIKQLLSVDSSAVDNQPLTISIVGAGGKTHLSTWLANFFKAQGERVCVTTTTKMYLPDTDRFDNLVNLSKGNLSSMAFADISRQTASTSFVYQKQLLRDTSNEPLKVKGLSQQAVQAMLASGLFSVVIIEADGAKHHPIKAPAEHEPSLVDGSQIVIGVIGAETIFSPANSNSIHRWPAFSAVTGCLAGMEINQQVLKRLIESPQGLFKNVPKQTVKIWVINKMDLCTAPNALHSLVDSLREELPLLTSIWLTQLNTPNAIKRVVLTQ